MKLNLGCGYAQPPGWLNVDRDPLCNPDLTHDLEIFPWPLSDNSAAIIRLHHVLEHLGQQPKDYLRIIQELYRVSQPNAEIIITVPHPRHDSYLIDPTHVRPILPESFQLFSQSLNRKWLETGKSNTTLGLQLNVDFEITKVENQLDPLWNSKWESNELTNEDVQDLSTKYSNVIQQITIYLRAVKTLSPPSKAT